MAYIKRTCDRCGKEKNLFKTKIDETEDGTKIFRIYCFRCRLKVTGNRPIKVLSRLKEYKENRYILDNH
jgi:hypothetical protein